MLATTVRQNDGHLVYALDDAYIHMAMAKNVANHGVWGVTPYEFSSSSSSPLWTLLLAAGVRLFTSSQLIPFLLNLGVATGMLWMVDRLVRRHGIGPTGRTLLLLAIVFVTPLPLLVFEGLEHILHAALTILFVYSAAAASGDRPVSRRSVAPLLVLGPFLTMTRYEGLFTVLLVAALFTIRRRIRVAGAVIGLGMLPVVLYGLISVANGWHFLPNSVLLKGDTPSLTSFWGVVGALGFDGYVKLIDTPALMMLVLAALLTLHVEIHRRGEIWRRSVVVLFLFLANTALHLQFARTGWFMRYEAYTISLGIVGIGIAAYPSTGPHFRSLGSILRAIRRHYVVALLATLAIVTLSARAALGMVILSAGTDNIYEQHYQVGRFVQQFYEGETVALNDIGAVNYLADVRCLDLWGLANLDVAAAWRTDTYDTEWLGSYAASQEVEIAIVYDDWFEAEEIGGVPSRWTKVGTWTIPNRVVAGGDTVSFYAVTPDAVDELAANFRAFVPELPADVVAHETYTQVRR